MVFRQGYGGTIYSVGYNDFDFLFCEKGQEGGIAMENNSIILLLGFIGSMIAIITPIIKLNTSITKLNVTLENMNETVTKNDKRVDDHEVRLVRLEEHNR